MAVTGFSGAGCRCSGESLVKVLHVITGLEAGGAEGFLVRLLTAGLPGDEAVVVSLSSRGRYAETIEQLGVPVYTLAMGRGFPSPLALVKLYSVIRREKPDILVSWMYHANFLAGMVAFLFPGIPLVWTVHHADLDPKLNKRRTVRIARWCARLSFRCAAVVYVSERSRGMHESLGYRPGRSVVLPLGVDSTVFRPDESLREQCRAEWGAGYEDFVFGLIARYDPLKNHAGFLRAAGRVARRVPNVRFVLAGSGADSSNTILLRIAEESGFANRVCWLGHRADVPAILNGLDALVLSSHGESFPTVLCEALFCGKPCVTTDVGDAAKIVGPHGCVVAPGDEHALADAMESLAGLSFAERAERYGGARERALSLFDMHVVAGRYRELLALVSGPRKVP